MKKRIFILLSIVFSVFYSQDYTNEKNKEIRKFFLTIKDFEYFKYNTSSCDFDMGKKYELDFDSAEAMLYFYLNDNNKPIGKWELSMNIEDEEVIFIEECYKEGKMIKKYIYSYNSILKKRTLKSGVIYYPKKGREYYVNYTNDQSVEAVYFGINNDGYNFYIRDNGKLIAMKTLFIEFPNSESLYGTYKSEINKILELEN